MTRAAALFLTLAAAGCATTPRWQPDHLVVTIEASQADIWQAVMTTLDRAQFRARQADERRGFLVAERSYGPEQIQQLVAGAEQRPSAWWSLEAALLIEVSAVSPLETRLEIRSRMLGRRNPTARGAWLRRSGVMPLSSNGSLEREILEGVLSRYRADWRFGEAVRAR